MKKTWKDIYKIIFDRFNNGRLKKKYSLSELLFLAGHLKSKTGAFDLKKWNLETEKIKDRIEVARERKKKRGGGWESLRNWMRCRSIIKKIRK